MSADERELPIPFHPTDIEQVLNEQKPFILC